MLKSVMLNPAGSSCLVQCHGPQGSILIRSILVYFPDWWTLALAAWFIILWNTYSPIFWSLSINTASSWMNSTSFCKLMRYVRRPRFIQTIIDNTKVPAVAWELTIYSAETLYMYTHRLLTMDWADRRSPATEIDASATELTDC